MQICLASDTVFQCGTLCFGIKEQRISSVSAARKTSAVTNTQTKVGGECEIIWVWYVTCPKLALTEEYMEGRVVLIRGCSGSRGRAVPSQLPH